jgi:general stress protein YciG
MAHLQKSTEGEQQMKSAAKRLQGFASLKRRDPAKLHEIASLGGKAAHAHGTAYEWNSEQAARAGQLGGLASQANRRALRKKRNEAFDA